MQDTQGRERINDLSLEDRIALESQLLESRREKLVEARIQRGTEEGERPLSFAQERLWFLDRLYPSTPLYNVAWAAHVAGSLDRQALQQALDMLVARHSTLRTVFRDVDGIPRRESHPDPHVRLRMVDLRADGRDVSDRLSSLLADEARSPFDLSKDLMLRATVVQLADQEHILLLVAHHIAIDGWSRSILNRELDALYSGWVAGHNTVLSSPPIDYADFATWQRADAESADFERRLSYWQERLHGMPPTLELPRSASEIPGALFQGDAVPIHISEPIAHQLRQMAAHTGCTPFMVLAAAVLMTLHRYTGEADIPIGTPVAGRSRVETEDLVGLFVNTLVLRGDLSGRPTFREVLARVRDTALGAYDHQNVPFERIVAETAAERNTDRSPIFQVMLSYGTYPFAPIRLGELAVTPWAVDTGTSKFDLAFDLRDTDDGIEGSLIFACRFFARERMEALVRHFLELLRTGLEAPDMRIGKLPMLTPKEVERQVHEWNAATTPEPMAETVLQHFEAAVEVSPDRTAVVCDGRGLSYATLNRRADQIAIALQDLGVERNELVGIAMDRSENLIAGILGILKSGAAYLPLDPRFPIDRLRFMMEDAEARILVTEDGLLDALSMTDVRRLLLDEAWFASVPHTAITASGSGPDDLAYVMYTSGSTGKPKGVKIAHRNLVGFINSYRPVVDLGIPRIGTHVITYAFDTSVEEIFSTLCFGGTLHVVPYEMTLDGRRLGEYVLDHGVNTSYIVPDFLPMVAQVFEERGECGALACLITGLAPKKEGVLQRFRDLSESLRIVNAYGPTEVTYGATAHLFQTTDDPGRDAPIGKPFPNYQIYLVSADLEPVPIGVPGEILIGGVGVASGYLRRPLETEERFIPDPFSDDPEARVYRTGDLGRYQEDGTIEFLGRNDSQVKIRGHRIELREIALAIEDLPDVSVGHVTPATLSEDDIRLVAYVVLEPGRACDGAALRTQLAKRLPEYMLPAAFVFLNALPLLPSGKVDGRSLPEPEWRREALGGQVVPPTTPTEHEIARIWGKVLQIDRVGVTDNFFDLGGHSLLALRVFSLMEDVLGRTLPIGELFRYPTVRELARVLDERSNSMPSILVPIQSRGAKPPLFLVHAGGGHVLFYKDLARRMGRDRPIYGFEAIGTRGVTPHEQVEAMADHYIEEMMQIQPEGPYHLGGSSMGGLVAFEMAIRLKAQGHQVGLVALLDTHIGVLSAPRHRGDRRSLRTVRSRMARLAGNLWRLPLRDKAFYARAKFDKGVLLLRRWARRRFAPLIQLLPWTVTGQISRGLAETQRAIDQAFRSYLPGRLPGTAVLFRATEQARGFRDDPLLGWGDRVDDLRVHEIEGFHGDIVSEPAVGGLIGPLLAELERCDRERT